MRKRIESVGVVGGLLAVSMLSLGGCASPDLAKPFKARHWVGVWAASPSDASSITLSDQTVRMIVAPHFGGRTLRLRLSNRFGTSPVKLDRVDVALHARGAQIVPGSGRVVRFGGGLVARMAPGTDVTSDPVRLRFRAFEELVVSVYVAGSIAHPTEHYITRQTNYRTLSGTGDHVRDQSGAAFVQTLRPAGGPTGWYFLDGVDVVAKAAVGTVVCLGDSITDGFEGKHSPLVENPAGVNANGRYPDDLARRLLAAHRSLSVVNAGIGGNEILGHSAPISGPSALARLRQDVIDQPGVRDAIILEGINDIGAGRATADQIISGLERIVSRLHQAHIHVLLGTLTPAEGTITPSEGSAAANAERERINHWIRSQHLAEVVDFDMAVRDPRDPSRIYPPYDDSDHLHFNLRGYQAMAAAVNPAELR